MLSQTLAALAMAAIAAQAIAIQSPSDTDVWQSGTLSQTVTWLAVSTDPTSFAIQLVNQEGYLTDSPVTLIANQSTGAADVVNSVTVTYPSGSSWPTGVAFQVNFVTSTSNSAILAQSDQFNITASAASSSSSSSASSSASSTSSTSTTSASASSSSSSASGAVTITSAASSASASSNVSIPNATSAKSSGVLGAPIYPAAVLGALAGVAGIATFFL